MFVLPHHRFDRNHCGFCKAVGLSLVIEGIEEWLSASHLRYSASSITKLMTSLQYDTARCT